MSPYAVPLSGPASVRAADPPRDSAVEFSDGVTTVSLPVREALPVLARARRGGRPHPSVAALAEAGVLALRLVGAGRFEPGDGRWLPGALEPAEDDRVRRLAVEASSETWSPERAEAQVRELVAAVVDALPRGTPMGSPRGTTSGTARATAAVTGFRGRLASELSRTRRSPARLPALVTVSLRVEADEEELVAGSVRLVLQVHDELDPLHLCDAALLWTGTPEEHGFDDRARVHAAIALRAATQAWPVLDRLLELRVPDEITLDTDELVSLLDHGVGALRQAGVDVLWPRSLGRDLTTRATLEHRGEGAGREDPLMTGLFGPEAMFAFRWQVALHGEPLDDAEMRALAATASPILKLRGAWTVVDPAIARKAKKRLIRTITPVQAVAAALTGTIEVDETDQEVVVGASLLRVRERLLGAATRDPVASPRALRATLRDYQRHGLTWLDQLTSLGLGACLADDMGLGKTVTVIALHLHRLESGPGAARPTLVVCPASLLGNWEDEIERFAPGTPVRRFHGGRRSVADLEGGLPGTDPGFVLTTYGTLRSDQAAGGSGARLRDVAWGLVVADEAQHVKNPASAAARALRAIPGTARVALTGTPVENNLTELWAILDWAIPGLLGSRNAFRKVWAAPIESGVHEEKARQFSDLVGPFVLRRRKSDPGIAPELPPKTETDHPLGLTREQVVLYEAFVRDTMARIERADEDSRRGLVLALLTGLKQICNHPAQFLKQSGAVRLSGRSHKLDLLDELLVTIVAEGGAALVFTQYVAMARLLETHLDRLGLTHQLLHGGTPVRERDAMVRRFQQGEVPVFLLSLKAGGTGLNLTRADHVIHVDRWWNPAVEDQATDRAYRIGQDKPVQVHRMVTRGTIEERIAELLARKRALADAVLGRGETALTELADDELRDLVTLRPTPGDPDE